VGFFSKALNRAAKSATRSVKTAAKPKRAGPAAKPLTFKRNGTAPATDEAGRVIVKLSAGSEFEVEADLWGDSDGEKWLAGRRKSDDDDIERNVKVRVFDAPDSARRLLHIESPTGAKLGHLWQNDAVALVDQVTAHLRNEPALAQSRFVFELSGHVEGSWQQDEDDDDAAAAAAEQDLDLSLTIRVRVPLVVDIA